MNRSLAALSRTQRSAAPTPAAPILQRRCARGTHTSFAFVIDPSYQAFVQAVLTPRVYDDHVIAYRDCCCPSGPATYPSWIGVTSSVPLPCAAVGAAIRQFGSSHGSPGTW